MKLSLVPVLVVLSIVSAPTIDARQLKNPATAPASGNGPVASDNTKRRAVPIFDALPAEPEVIYLLASSSVVFGPDPKGRSEEVTFAGLVTIPKWPMKGFARRTLDDGRQQIDLELTESALAGESYLLGERIELGEHPDLRSLGTITEPGPPPSGRLTAALFSESPIVAPSLFAPAREPLPPLAPAALQPAQTARPTAPQMTYPITENLEKLMAANPNILWDEMIAAELRRTAIPRLDEIRGRKIEPRLVPPPGARRVARRITLPEDINRIVAANPNIRWQMWVYDANERLAADLLERQVIKLDRVFYDAALIPNDFVVARKVLITTAKGILYNETPVPVRGSLDAIPPVKQPSSAPGLNVFRGMELPIELLDAKGHVSGWFYSKAHMAYAVRPDAIQRNRVRAEIEFEAGGATERVVLEGPAEIHHYSKSGERDLEVIVLGLRGRSELLGGDIMLVETFSDRDHFSQGRLDKANQLDTLRLFVQLYTPSDKLANEDPIVLGGGFDAFKPAGEIARHRLSIPLLTGAASKPLVSRAPAELLDEAGRSVARVVKIELRFLGN